MKIQVVESVLKANDADEMVVVANDERDSLVGHDDLREPHVRARADRVETRIDEQLRWQDRSAVGQGRAVGERIERRRVLGPPRRNQDAFGCHGYKPLSLA